MNAFLPVLRMSKKPVTLEFEKTKDGNLYKKVFSPDGVNYRAVTLVDSKNKVIAKRLVKYHTSLGGSSTGIQLSYKNMAEAKKHENDWLMGEQTYSKGGVLVGASHEDGGIKIKTPEGQIEAEGGEIIINAKSSKKYREELSEINQAEGGVAIPEEAFDKDNFKSGGKVGDPFLQFDKIVKESKDFDDAYAKTRAIKNVPYNVSNEFYKQYAQDGKVGMKESFRAFYDERKLAHGGHIPAKPYYLLTQNEVVAERERLEGLVDDWSTEEAIRMKNLSRYCLSKFGVLLKDLKTTEMSEKTPYYVEVSVRDAQQANQIIDGDNIYKREVVKESSSKFGLYDKHLAKELGEEFLRQGLEVAGVESSYKKMANGGDVPFATYDERGYSWGVLRTVSFGPKGIDGKAIIHPEEWEKISSLKAGQSIRFKDEQGIDWNVEYKGDSIFHIEGSGSGRGLSGDFSVSGEYKKGGAVGSIFDRKGNKVRVSIPSKQDDINSFGTGEDLKTTNMENEGYYLKIGNIVNDVEGGTKWKIFNTNSLVVIELSRHGAFETHEHRVSVNWDKFAMMMAEKKINIEGHPYETNRDEALLATEIVAIKRAISEQRANAEVARVTDESHDIIEEVAKKERAHKETMSAVEALDTPMAVKIRKTDGFGGWTSGDIGSYSFSAKVFEEGSDYGIENGKVSKLSVSDSKSQILNYDRGWDVKPKTAEQKKVLKAILKFFKTWDGTMPSASAGKKKSLASGGPVPDALGAYLSKKPSEINDINKIPYEVVVSNAEYLNSLPIRIIPLKELFNDWDASERVGPFLWRGMIGNESKDILVDPQGYNYPRYAGWFYSSHLDKKMGKGGSIPNNYEGKTPAQVWDAWTEKQRVHFITDHIDEINKRSEPFGEKYGTSISAGNFLGGKDYSELPKAVKQILIEHFVEGQYKKGGEVFSEKDALERVNLDSLDEFELKSYARATRRGMSKYEALAMLLSEVEYDSSQLSPQLAKIADMESARVENGPYKKGGKVSNEKKDLAEVKGSLANKFRKLVKAKSKKKSSKKPTLAHKAMVKYAKVCGYDAPPSKWSASDYSLKGWNKLIKDARSEKTVSYGVK